MKHVKLVGTFSLLIQIWLGDLTAFRYFFIFLTYVYDLSYLPERFVVTLNKILNAFKYLWNICHWDTIKFEKLSFYWNFHVLFN